jgi:quercetin dioxygenase-like cupin family protein
MSVGNRGMAMSTFMRQSSIAAFGLLILGAMPVDAQLMSTCVEKPALAPGELGCSILQTKLLPDGLREPLFWHIDRFPTEQTALSAVHAASVAFQDGGLWWLMTIESDTSDHRGGKHVTAARLSPWPTAERYSMLVQSAVFSPGMYSLVHHHTGIEGVYVVEGEGCYETPTHAWKMQKGETLVMAAGTPMRAVVTGSTRRHVLAVIVHDAAQPATIRMADGVGPQLAACR